MVLVTNNAADYAADEEPVRAGKMQRRAKTDHPTIKINITDSSEHWSDWETLSIPSPSSPLSKWTVSRTKKLKHRRKTFTRINELGEFEQWECVPLYRVYVKKVKKAEAQRSSPTSDELLSKSIGSLMPFIVNKK